MEEKVSEANTLLTTAQPAVRLPPGKRKILLGMAAGVGKSQAILLAAQERISEGVDVVVGGGISSGGVDWSADSAADTFPTDAAHFIPLRTPNRVVGVIGLSLRRERRLTFAQELQLETFVNQMALVVERQLLDHAARQSALLQESERMHTTPLNAISQEIS